MGRIGRAEALAGLKGLSRESGNGHEVTVCIHGHNGPDWSWVAIRYPLAEDRIKEPTEIIHDFDGKTWPDILEWAEEYLRDHPDDGFYFV